MTRKQTPAVWVAIALAAFAVPVAAADTATDLRLQSVEARLPDVGRLAALEQRVQRLAQAGGQGAGDDVIFNLYQDVQALSEDVRQLRGAVEELKYQARQREQRQRDLYKSLDERLKALEGGAGIADSPAQAGGAGPPAGANQRGGGRDSGAEQAYLAAFEMLKAGDYSGAQQSFEAFLDDYPRGQYTDNAWYWLGEAHYVEGQYDEALQAFLHVVEDYPDSSKVPGALYKRGLILNEQGDSQAARREFQQVLDEHPDAEAAGLAREKIAAMGGG